MFWQSIVDGLAIFLNWQVWAAMVAYAAIWFGFMLACGALVDGGSEARALGGGCLYMIGGLVLQAILTGLLVGWLMPIFFGQARGMPVSDMVSLAWPLAKVSLVAMVLVLVLCILPGIGGIVANAPGMQQ